MLPSLMSEQFPVETRAVGVAFSYSISVTVFGGFAPFVATWLIAATGDSAVAELLPDVHRAAQHYRIDGGAAAARWHRLGGPL